MVRALNVDFEAIAVVELSPVNARLAADLASQFALRGFDAIHLASALELATLSGRMPVFSCFDDHLAKPPERRAWPWPGCFCASDLSHAGRDRAAAAVKSSLPSLGSGFRAAQIGISGSWIRLSSAKNARSSPSKRAFERRQRPFSVCGSGFRAAREPDRRSRKSLWSGARAYSTIPKRRFVPLERVFRATRALSRVARRRGAVLRSLDRVREIGCTRASSALRSRRELTRLGSRPRALGPGAPRPWRLCASAS